MLINIRELVEPISRGVLVDDVEPGLSAAGRRVRRGARPRAASSLWCHNGNGMEAPVAAALGRLDGLNLFDPYWMDPEYDIWYALLNCGIRLPASTGSDWFVCSSNRVYVDVGRDFSYEAWLDWPPRRADVRHRRPGPAAARSTATRRATTSLGLAGDPAERDGRRWSGRDPPAHRPRSRSCATARSSPRRSWRTARGRDDSRLSVDVGRAPAGWPPRCWGRRRTSYGHALWAHTSPVYLRERPGSRIVRAAAETLIEADRSLPGLAPVSGPIRRRISENSHAPALRRRAGGVRALSPRSLRVRAGPGRTRADLPTRAGSAHAPGSGSRASGVRRACPRKRSRAT